MPAVIGGVRVAVVAVPEVFPALEVQKLQPQPAAAAAALFLAVPVALVLTGNLTLPVGPVAVLLILAAAGVEPQDIPVTVGPVVQVMLVVLRVLPEQAVRAAAAAAAVVVIIQSMSLTIYMPAAGAGGV